MKNKLECHLAFDNRCSWMWTLSSLFAGFKLLENQGLLKVKSVSMDRKFLADGRYPHRMIFELKAQGKTIAYDMSDGYQDITIPEIFDAQLDKLDYYFKSSYDPEFAKKLRNKDKFKPLSMSYTCTCKGNYFEKANFFDALESRQFKNALYQFVRISRAQKLGDYKLYESHNHYNDYRIMFWSRLWSIKTTPEAQLKIYPELSFEQAKIKAEKQNEMMLKVNRTRIESVKSLRNALGDKFVGGLSDDEISRSMAPELIVTDPVIASKNGYINMLKQNYINVLSMGLHGCIGARYGESIAAGRAVLTDPLMYTPPGNFEKDKNYVEYTDAQSLVSKAEYMLENVGFVHEIEDANHEYYNEYVRPDSRILKTLQIAFPEYF